MQSDAPACDVCGSITVRSRDVLQVPELREFDGVQLILRNEFAAELEMSCNSQKYILAKASG